MKRRGKILKITAIILSIIIVVPVLAFVAKRGVYVPILRARNKIAAPGIDLMEAVEIGGIQQVLYFRGRNINNPVILFLHGGPGLPMMPFIHGYQYDLEHDFTVVNWDQRQAGKTFLINNPDTIIETLSIEQMLADAHEVTQHIKQTLDKDKIIIIGFSWGSVLGTALVQTYPEDYSAYIGVGQIINVDEGERVAHEKILEIARVSGNQNDIVALEAFAPYPPPIGSPERQEVIMDMWSYQRKYKLPWGIGIPGLFIRYGLTTPYYTIGELLQSVSANVSDYYSATLYNFVDEYNARNYGVNYEVPVYYIMGVDDWQTPYSVAKDFFAEIFAPDKEFYSIPDAGHWTMFDDKAEFNRVLLEEIIQRIS